MPLPADTRYLPPGTIKSELDTIPMILFVRGRRISLSYLKFCFWNALHSSIHLRGAIAARSSSKTLISGMGKLGRKRVFSRHIRWSTVTQTIRFRVASSRVLQVLICLKQPKDSMLSDDIPCAVPGYRTDEEACRLWSVNPMDYSWGWTPAASDPLQLKIARVKTVGWKVGWSMVSRW